jgi:hypothetical protein
MDGIRYAITSLVKKPDIIIPQQSLPKEGYYQELGL